MWTVRDRDQFPIFVRFERSPVFGEEGALTQLDDVANNSHDQEAHADGLGDAQEFALVGCERKRGVSDMDV